MRLPSRYSRREARRPFHASGRRPIAQTFAFYNARAEEAAAEAGKATLDNVRDRALRAERTWRSLADQAQKVEDDRAKAKVERQERLDREAAEAEAATEAAREA